MYRFFLLSFQRSGLKYSLNNILFFLLLLFQFSFGLTRWSSIQFVPDADLLSAGSFVISANGYYLSNVDEGTTIVPSAFFNFGLIEWVNLEAGYAGGPSLGLKARILGETRPWMPSLAIGTRNIFTHREANMFDQPLDSLGSEFYLVAAKSIESLRLRLHLGGQTIPNESKEAACPFVALEKYFGVGLYVTVEAYYREKEIHPSVFTSWRLFKKKLEISAGIFDVTGMFLNDDDISPNSPYYESGDANFVRPGVWFGLRYSGGFKFGKSGGITGIENSLNTHSESIGSLRSEVDSLKMLLKRSNASIETLNRTLMQITDSSKSEQYKYLKIAHEKLALLSTLYKAEPFQPQEVNRAMAELIAGRDDILPALYDVISDPVQETKTRVLAVSALGEIGSQAASDIVIGLLGQSTIPEITIECLIALGKMKETRAVYLMQQLSSDPNDDVAFTASEILQKLEEETGVSTSSLKVSKPAPVSIPEKSIGGTELTGRKKTPPPEPSPEIIMDNSVPESSLTHSGGNGEIQGIEKPVITEATVTTENNYSEALVEDTIADNSTKAAELIPEAKILPMKKEMQEVDVVAPVKPGAGVNEKQGKQQNGTSSVSESKERNKEKPDAEEIKKEKKKKKIDMSSESW